MMVRDLLLDIVNKWRISDLILLFILTLTFILTWLTVLSLGLKILKVEIKIKHIIPGALIGSCISVFIRPFIPGALAFFSFLIPFLVCLKCYSKAKWIIASWVTFLVLLSSAIFPILISPLLSSNHALGLFFFQNKYSMPITSLMETFGAAFVLAFLTIFNIPLIPSPTPLLTSIDFFDVYMFLALCFWCYLSSVEIWKNLMQFSMWALITWTVAAMALIAFYMRKINEQRKNQEYQRKEQERQEKEQEYQKKLEAKDNQIQELTDLTIKNQQNNKPKPKVPHPDLENREKKIIKGIIQGKNNDEIANDIYVSDGRIGNLITPIYRKLGVKNRYQLIIYIMENNLLDWIHED
jgi:DNA-binding CsgD family transcriptional regulator